MAVLVSVRFLTTFLTTVTEPLDYKAVFLLFVFLFVYHYHIFFLWRRGGEVVSASYFRSGDERVGATRWSELQLTRALFRSSLHKKLYSTLSLSTQVYNWVPPHRWVNLTK